MKLGFGSDNEEELKDEKGRKRSKIIEERRGKGE